MPTDKALQVFYGTVPLIAAILLQTGTTTNGWLIWANASTT